MRRALTATLTATTVGLAACGGATSEDLPQENVPDELKGQRAVKIVLPNGSTYNVCELPP